MKYTKRINGVIDKFIHSSHRRSKNVIIETTNKLNFGHILLVWLVVILVFGCIYLFGANENSYLMYSTTEIAVSKLADTIYFSFVAATTTGFGDIVPVGAFKIISTLEVICGLLILAIVTSKLVSIKQDQIMEELYELSLNEKVNRLRSSLLLFRQNIGRIITRLEENSFKKKEIADIAIHITPFEDTLNEVINYIGRSKKNQFAKNIDQIDIELTLNSVVSSLEKLNELIELLNAFDTTTYRKTITDQINKCIKLSKLLFEKVNIIYALPKQTFEELNTVKENIIEELEKNLLVEKKE